MMPLRPVDMQVMMPRINDQATMNQNAMNKADAFQQQLAATIQSEASKVTKQVVDPSKADEAKIKEKEEKNKKNQDNKQQNKKNKKKSDISKEINKQKGGTIDIKI